ncbi:hypothetical protein BpOF4_21399 (plasmid) [Alkalihalophilus pseudofirmus OF4]|uniref:Uncharacterized protein n=1 Tax=Alkalihalophilus pseudofirmus (strain ATCC BAA-2126 / JCM 17055 / OF4) TaxID=398511 RepID=D3G1P9_ALKPO|nr:hypothetical protein [Alkalihalophilus pseudofirmus]ADC52275.1 hypothetical protein BpOF4_21399 [Alkalihalophilus pseudofirmus OF4]
MRRFELDFERTKTSNQKKFHVQGLTTGSDEPIQEDHLKSTQTAKPKRKIRSDKKIDIKVPITIEQKQKLKILARLESVKTNERVSITQMASMLVQEGLVQYESFPENTYDASLNTIHVKLTSFYAEQLFNFELEWDVSKREAAAKILSYILGKSEVNE